MDPNTLEPLGNLVRLTISPHEERNCSLSPDGTKLAYADWHIERHLYSIPRNHDTGLIAGEAQQITSKGQLNYYPGLSPDGELLVWTQQNSGQGLLYYMRLSEQLAHKATPRWERSNREVGASLSAQNQVVFASTIRGSYELWRMEQFGGVMLPLTRTQQPTSDGQTAWSPDGQRILFYSNRAGNWDIWSIDVSGKSEPHQLTTWPSNELYPAWSPDGAWIAFLSDRQGNPDIWKVDQNGRTFRSYVEHPAEEGPFAWSPDGRFFYFSSNRSGKFNIWFMPASGAPANQFTQYQEYGFGLAESSLYTKFAVSQSELIVPLERRESNIYILENLQSHTPGQTGR